MSAKTVHLETFGCQMNELDSELVMGALRALGYRFTDEPDHADVILYNTCSVRDHAEQKVRSRLGELRARKEQQPTLVVGVLGCMAERDGPDLIARMPVVDVLCGPGELDRLPALLDNAVRTRASLASESAPEGAPARLTSARQIALQGNASRRSATLAAAEDSLEMLDLSRSIAPDEHKGTAYVRITRGCNKFCSYCVVPHTRGAEVHRPPEHIIDECKRLADAGVIEITLLGQTVNHYRFEHGSAVTIGGVVQPQKGRTYAGGHRRDPFSGERTTTFADLLRRIHDEVPAVRRLRFVTSYPRDFGDDALEAIRDCPRICRFLHVPAQSGSNRMLKAMNRGYTIEEYLEFVERAKAILHEPERGRPLSIAGDIIAGFSGETEEDHDATKALLRAVDYKNCFIFKYSPRPGTTAFDRLPDDVPEEVKRRRVNELLALQQQRSESFGREQVGHEVEVFIQGRSAQQRKKSRVPVRSDAVSLTIRGQSSDASCPITNEPTAREDEESSIQMTSRTEGDLIVVFDCPPGTSPELLEGMIGRVRVESARSLTLFGTFLGFPASPALQDTERGGGLPAKVL